MEEQKNIHAGHRERHVKKFCKNSELFADHELLELLLFYALPRVDTNALAHKLITAFGSLSAILNASIDELKVVAGVGERTAVLIKTVGVLADRKAKGEELRKPKKFSAFADVKEELLQYYKGVDSEETFLIILLDKKYKKIFKLSYTDNDRYEVSTNIPEIASAFAITKPAYAIIAHNHTSKSCLPSVADDFATKKINLLCELHGVTLLDHVIVNKQETFSYYTEGRMDYIKDIADINKLFNQLKEGEKL